MATILSVEKMKELVLITLKSREFPTPLLDDGVIPVDKSVIDLCGTTIMLRGMQMISNFLLTDCQICTGEPDIGHTQFIVTPGANFQSKTFSSGKKFTKLQLKYAEAGSGDFISDITMSIQTAWEQMLEKIIIYGDPVDGVSGFLYGSGIPQFSDAFNFFNGSMTGIQMVDTMVNYATQVSDATQYVYNTRKMILPSNLVKVLVQTTVNTTDSRSALTVLKERLAMLPGGPVELYTASSLIPAKMIIMLPDDEKAVALHATDIEFFISEKDIEGAAATAGIVPIVPASTGIIRLN